MPQLPAPIHAYIQAYNAMDVSGMLACLTDDVVFRNISGGAQTARAEGKAAFGELAGFGVTVFEQRHQAVTNAITVDDVTLAEIDFTGVVAADLPNGWVAGQALRFSGASAFVVRDGRIASIVDQS